MGDIMKIIWKSNKSVQRECCNCGSILEIKKIDLKHSPFYHDKVFTCPVCEISCPISQLDMFKL